MMTLTLTAQWKRTLGRAEMDPAQMTRLFRGLYGHKLHLTEHSFSRLRKITVTLHLDSDLKVFLAANCFSYEVTFGYIHFKLLTKTISDPQWGLNIWLMHLCVLFHNTQG